MKNILGIFVTVGLIMFGTSCKKTEEIRTTVSRDCTGIYLRVDGIDHKVCNSELISDYENNEVINLTYKECNSCEDPNEIICMLFHDFDGYVQIKSVTPKNRIQ